MPAKSADGVNVNDRVVLNDYICGERDVLHEDNFKKALDFLNDFWHINPRKILWLYTKFTWKDILNEDYRFLEEHDSLRKAIVAQCHVFVECSHCGKIKGQRIIDIQKTLQKGEIVLWCN